MNNKMIGIASVFALTCFLLVLRHWFLSIGRPNRSRHDSTNKTQHGGFERNARAVEDDARLLCSRDIEAGSPNSAGGATRAAVAPHEGMSPMRFSAGRGGLTRRDNKGNVIQ